MTPAGIVHLQRLAAVAYERARHCRQRARERKPEPPGFAAFVHEEANIHAESGARLSAAARTAMGVES